MVWKRKFANNYLPQNQTTATSARYRHVEQSQRAMALATKRRMRAHAIRGGIDSLGENHAGAANTITITVTVADRRSAAATERLQNQQRLDASLFPAGKTRQPAQEHTPRE
jgi:hypothetical protein